MNKKNTQSNTQGGQVIIINTLLFFALATAMIFGVTSPVISSFQTTKSFSKSKQAFLLANSASSEALYKLNAGMTLASAETVTLSQGSVDIVVADAGDTKTISVDSDVDGYERNYEMVLSTGEGVSFNYGLQVGQGGFEMTNNAIVYGNVYANGDIVGYNSATISGTAVAANVSDPVVDTSNNGGTIDPPYSMNFGGNSAATPQDISQSFTVSTTTPVSSVRVLLKKTGAPSNITLRIKNDTSGSPGSTTLGSGTISASTVTSTFGYLTIPLSATVALTPGTTYWIVLDGSNYGSGKYYTSGANDSTYAGGVAKISTGGSTWASASPATRDLYFDIYVGGDTGLITGVTVGGDAWANTVNSSTVTGALHCQVGTGNNKVCDTSWADPVQQAWPISEGNIQEWKDTATAGGATSTISLSGNQQMTLDSVKVDGNISLSNDSRIYINGTVYVTGNITISNQSQIRVNPALGASSAVIVTDGRVQTSNDGQFNGSGTSGSYIMVVSTSACPSGSGCSGGNAIEINNNSGSVILNAQNGTLKFTNNAAAKQATAKKIIMNNNTTVTYESGLANPSFTSGPSGSWGIESWKEVE